MNTTANIAKRKALLESLMASVDTITPEENVHIMELCLKLAEDTGEIHDCSLWQTYTNLNAFTVELDRAITTERSVTALEKTMYSIICDDISGLVESVSGKIVLTDGEGIDYHSYIEIFSGWLTTQWETYLQMEVSQEPCTVMCSHNINDACPYQLKRLCPKWIAMQEFWDNLKD